MRNTISVQEYAEAFVHAHPEPESEKNPDRSAWLWSSTKHPLRRRSGPFALVASSTMFIRPSFSGRDFVLLMLGAFLTQFLSIIHSHSFSDTNIDVNSRVQHIHDVLWGKDASPESQIVRQPDEIATDLTPEPSIPLQTIHGDLPHTSIIHHAPGWTLFRNLYMSNGTLFLLSSNRSFPEFRLMISSAIHMVNTPENAALSEPTLQHMNYITPLEARKRWGGTKNRVWTVEGNTVCFSNRMRYPSSYHFLSSSSMNQVNFWDISIT